ncbi:hypothetical protein [Mycobacterium sp.]|jgi:hypothetical protein
MNMQYARAVLAHEQAYRDRARADYLTTNRPSQHIEADRRVAALPVGSM